MVGSPPAPVLPVVPPTSFGTLQLRLSSGAQQGRIVELAAPKCSIGSAPRCTLRLRAAGIQPIHCLVDRSGDITVVRRHAGEATLNGQSFEQSPLRVGDRLRLGPLEFEVVIDHKPSTAAVQPLPPLSPEQSLPEPPSQPELATATYTDQFRQLDSRFEDLEQRLTELGRTLASPPAAAAAAPSEAELLAERRDELGRLTTQVIDQLSPQFNEQLRTQVAELSGRLTSDSTARIDEAAVRMQEGLAVRVQEELAQMTPTVAAQVADDLSQRLSQQLPENVREQVSTQLDVVAERLNGQLGDELAATTAELGEQLAEQLIEQVDMAVAHRVPLEVALRLGAFSGEVVDTITADVTHRVAEEIATRLDPNVSRQVQEETQRLQRDLELTLSERLTPEISRQVSAELTPRLTAEMARHVNDEVVPRLTADVAAEVTEQITDRLTQETTQRVSAKVTARILAEIDTRIEPELAARLAEQVTTQVAALVSPRIDAGLASWETDRADWSERQQEMQTQIAAHSEQLDSRLQSIVALQQAVESQCEQWRQSLDGDQPQPAARLEQIEQSLDELRQQQAAWVDQRNQWQQELRQVREELSERAEKTRGQVSKLEARWETFEDEQRHRQTDHEHSTSEQIDQRLAGIRAEREAFESERLHDRGQVHPGDHVRQIDERLAEIQAQRGSARERQSVWQDNPQVAASVATDMPPAAMPATFVQEAEAVTEQAIVAAPNADPAAVDNDPSLPEISSLTAEAATHQPVGDVAESVVEAAADASEAPLDAPASETPQEVSFQSPSEHSPASALQLFSQLQRQEDAEDASAPRGVPVPAQATLPPAMAPLQATSEASPVAGEDEESIEAYMARLMQRVRTVSDVPGQQPASHAAPRKALAADQLNTPAPEPQPAAEPPEAQAIVDLSELAPRSLPAESASNISAMRDLANSSARTAIHTHHRKRMSAVIYSKLAVAIASLVASVALAWMSNDNKPISYAAALVAMVIGVVWGLEYLVLTGSRLFESDGSHDKEPTAEKQAQ